MNLTNEVRAGYLALKTGERQLSQRQAQALIDFIEATAAEATKLILPLEKERKGGKLQKKVMKWVKWILDGLVIILALLVVILAIWQFG